ncbi:hypothetical protein EYF80_020244 [Liparis tanakae]|uniref:Uncharacterized protein n=1 Tax=Liparis tanakae TaxID=230148 RepID=A0A4Z2HUU6_9TELE|nr:hypothetical protein EYF80_020244 [Liparis tanakae]
MMHDLQQQQRSTGSHLSGGRGSVPARPAAAHQRRQCAEHEDRTAEPHPPGRRADRSPAGPDPSGRETDIAQQAELRTCPRSRTW